MVPTVMTIVPFCPSMYTPPPLAAEQLRMEPPAMDRLALFRQMPPPLPVVVAFWRVALRPRVIVLPAQTAFTIRVFSVAVTFAWLPSNTIPVIVRLVLAVIIACPVSITGSRVIVQKVPVLPR